MVHGVNSFEFESHVVLNIHCSLMCNNKSSKLTTEKVTFYLNERYREKEPKL